MYKVAALLEYFELLYISLTLLKSIHPFRHHKFAQLMLGNLQLFQLPFKQKT